MTSHSAIEANNSIRFCIRSYIAFVLSPEAPLIEWLAKLDRWTKNSSDFFVSRPAVLDLSALKLGPAGLSHLLNQLAERKIRIIGLEGADASELGPSVPPLLTGGRPSARQDPGEAPGDVTASAAQPVAQEPSSLLIQAPIRSGQSVFFPNGDVTVLGSVASGSEIVAGGSIHVYGTLRGRAMAGAHRQRSRAHLLPAKRSRAACDQRLLPNRRRMGCRHCGAKPIQVMARRTAS